MNTTKYRIDFIEILPSGRRESQSITVSGPIENVIDALDEYSWDADSVTVTEYIGSDAEGRNVPESEWLLY